jgi:hypothetical protein
MLFSYATMYPNHDIDFKRRKQERKWVFRVGMTDTGSRKAYHIPEAGAVFDVRRSEWTREFSKGYS